MFRWFNLALEAATLIKQAIVDFCSLAGGSSETYQWSMDRDDSSLSLDHHYTIRLTGCYRMAARPPRAIGHFCDHPLAPDSTSIAPAPGEGNGAPATSLVPNAADFTTWYDVTWRWWAAVVGWPQRTSLLYDRRRQRSTRTSIQMSLNLDNWFTDEKVS